MKGKVIIACIIIICIPLVGVLAQLRVHNLCDETKELVKQAIEDCNNNAPDQTTISSAIELWEKHESFLTSLITHEEVDTVNLSLCSAKALIETGDIEGYYEALNQAIVNIRVVRNFDKPTIRSIF
ncbi:MAG: DUF4363 family protein [Clostridiaceae bacterium]|nr:DUF4363 family protein [Clostridiaceae bacterium]